MDAGAAGQRSGFPRDQDHGVRKKGGSSALNEARVNLMTMGPEGAKITNASQLIFFTTATDRNPAKSSMDMRNDRIIGDVNCVGYKLLYRDQILDQDATAESDGFPVYSLYRNLISAEDTVQNLLGQQDLWSAYTRYQQDETIPANFLVENVVEMTLILKWITRRRSAIPAATSRTRMPRSGRPCWCPS